MVSFASGPSPSFIQLLVSFFPFFSIFRCSLNWRSWTFLFTLLLSFLITKGMQQQNWTALHNILWLHSRVFEEGIHGLKSKQCNDSWLRSAVNFFSTIHSLDALCIEWFFMCPSLILSWSLFTSDSGSLLLVSLSFSFIPFSWMQWMFCFSFSWSLSG